MNSRFFCGDLDIRIDREGAWFYNGTPVMRKEMVCLFASVLLRDEEGDFWLITPDEMGRIEVEDTPFIGVELFFVGCGESQIISLRTNVDEIVTIDAAHPLRISINPTTHEPSPVVTVRDGLDARLGRAVYYELIERGEERRVGEKTLFGVWSAGLFFELGSLDEHE